MDCIHLEVNNWTKFNPRRDRKAHSWFRLENNLFERPESLRLTNDDLLVWLYILSQCSKKQSATVEIIPEHLFRLRGIELAACYSSVECLESLGYITRRRVDLKESKKIEEKINGNQAVTSRQPSGITTLRNEVSNVVNNLVSAKNNYSESKKTKQKRSNAAGDLAKNRQVWEEYREVYCKRYGIEPLRNAAVNKQISNLVKRLGVADAVAVVRFYLTHNDSFYIKKCHAIGQCLADCEALRTQMLTRKKVTGRDARELEKNSGISEMLNKIENGEL